MSLKERVDFKDLARFLHRLMNVGAVNLRFDYYWSDGVPCAGLVVKGRTADGRVLEASFEGFYDQDHLENDRKTVAKFIEGFVEGRL